MQKVQYIIIISKIAMILTFI